MKRTHLFPLLCVILFNLAACQLLPTAPPSPYGPAASPTPTAPVTYPAPVVVPVEISEVLASPPLTITARYPRVDAPGDPRYAALNRAAENLVRQQVESFRGEVTAPGFKPEPTVPGSFISISYEVLYGQNGLVSLLFTTHYYLSGAAHPNQSGTSLNFDLAQGKPLTLADLFDPSSAYLTALRDYCLQDLKAQQTLAWGENLTASPKTFTTWNIQPDGLRISFDPYIVAPYAAGPQKVLIPYAALKAYIYPAGPLASLVK